MLTHEVDEALDAAAAADDAGILAFRGLHAPTVSSTRRKKMVENAVRAFLENLPDHVSVRELLDARDWETNL